MGGKLNTTLWQNNYKEVCTYLTERNCSVNDVPDDAIFSNGKHMKHWLYEMNKALEGKSRYHLSDKQIELLNAIGINGLLSATDKDWLLHFEELRRFYSEHHHFKIPADYLCSDGTKLRGWIRLQRYRYRDGKLQQKYIDEFRKHDLMEALETPTCVISRNTTKNMAILTLRRAMYVRTGIPSELGSGHSVTKSIIRKTRSRFRRRSLTV